MVAGCVSAAAAFLQPWLTHWMTVFTWHSPFCGSADGGEVLPVNFMWTVWWTTTSIVVGAMAGQLTGRGRSGHAVATRLQLGMVAAAAAGSLTVVAALQGLFRVSAAVADRRDMASCLELSNFVPLVAWGIVFGAACAVAALWVPEIAIGLGFGWLMVWAGNVFIGIHESTQLERFVGAMPLDLMYVFGDRMSRSWAEGLTNAVVLGGLLLAGLLAFWAKRNWRRAVLGALSVHLIVIVGFFSGQQSYY